LKITDILILNKEEAEMVLSKNNIREKDLLKGLHSLTKGIIVITDKDKLITCYDGIKKYTLVPHKNVKVVERTGAGDAFVGAVLYQLLSFNPSELASIEIADWKKIIFNANKAGARTCEYMGAMEAYKHLSKAIFE
jgi:fructokinase